MINSNDSIRFTNVISKKYSFHYKNMDSTIESFIDEIIKHNLTVKGPLFYSINNVPVDEVIKGELFMPVKESVVNTEEGLIFHSYFSIENMISYCLYSNFKSDTEKVYKLLLDYIEEKGLKQITPIFHVLSGDRTLQYAFIKIGVADDVKKTFK